MRIKIVERGWETFSDFMGPVKFTNAVSDEDVADHMVMNIAGSLRVVEYVPELETGEGKQLGFSAEAVRRRDDHAPVDPECKHDSSVQEGTPDSAHRPPENAAAYTAEQLGEIADQRGIGGLREIGDRYGVKSRSIPELIFKILSKQADRKAKSEEVHR